MDVVVTGIGLLSTLGELQTSWRGLLQGRSGIRLCQPFSNLSPRPLALIDRTPSHLNVLIEQVVSAALQDASLSLPLPHCGVVIGSSRGYQGDWEQVACQFYDRYQSNTKSPETVLNSTFLHRWADSLPHMGAIATARQIGSTGPVLAPMAACATGLWAMAQAFELIQTGQCQQAIAGAAEAPITPLTLAGFQQMGALAKTGSYPFDRDREGLVLGEGAAVMVLESAAFAKHRGAPIYGRVLGFGMTADGYHVSAPAPNTKSAIAAVKQCLASSKLPPEAIDYLHAHGTGTILNDRNEANLIQTLFPAGPPISSTKGATGHTLGASGALGAAFCLLALKHQTLPPCVGLQQPAFDLTLIRASRPQMLKHVLCFSFGFGGQNAVMALGR